MSPALLEKTRRRKRRQAPLFNNELRRALPGSPPGLPHPDPESGSPDPVTARGEREPRSGGGRLTLEDQLEQIWEGLLAVGAAECPVCVGALEAGNGHAACRSCGSILS